MKLMFFCWAEEMRIELVHWLEYFFQYRGQFIIAPLIKQKEKSAYEKFFSQLNQIGSNIIVKPVYLKSPDSSFRNLLNPITLLNDSFSIFKVVNSTRPDVIVCFYLLHAYPIALISKIFNFLLCVVAMGSDVNLENNLFQRIAKDFVYRNSDIVFSASWKLKEIIEKDHGINVTVTPSSIDTSFFKPLKSKTLLRQKWNIDLGKQVIITVCRLDKNKAVDTLIRSLKILNSKDTTLLIVGEGVERKNLETLAATLGVNNDVTFLGYRNRNELIELYNLADIFALASYAEGLPRVLLEAMACGCVPIATNVGSIGAVVTNGFNGFTVEPGNPEMFSERVKEIMSFSEEKKKSMREMARQAVVENFESKKVLGIMVERVEALRTSQQKKETV